MATVQTVLGPVDASELGFTLSHEHVIVSNGQDRQNYPWLYDRQKTLLARGFVPASDVDTATQDLANAQASVRTARAKLDTVGQGRARGVGGIRPWSCLPRS